MRPGRKAVGKWSRMLNRFATNARFSRARPWTISFAPTNLRQSILSASASIPSARCQGSVWRSGASVQQSGSIRFGTIVKISESLRSFVNFVATR
jgi:hypothetical protein